MPNQAPTLPREDPTPASAGAEPAIRLRGLRKEFGPVRAVDGVDLDIPACSGRPGRARPPCCG
jgi:putative spermidine/putrescine transport system ATP-binding protein